MVHRNVPWYIWKYHGTLKYHEHAPWYFTLYYGTFEDTMVHLKVLVGTFEMYNWYIWDVPWYIKVLCKYTMVPYDVPWYIWNMPWYFALYRGTFKMYHGILKCTMVDINVLWYIWKYHGTLKYHEHVPWYFTL